MKGYEVFSTTADVGITIRGNRFDQLYLNAVAGFYALVTGRKDGRYPGGEPDSLSFEYRGDSCENVLVNLLSELIFWLYARNRVVPTLRIQEAGERFLKADMESYPLHGDPRVEIKSVTYHNLRLNRSGESKSVSVVFDV